MSRQEFLTALPSLIKNYQPSKDVLEKISHVKLCMIVGPTGVGKSTIITYSGITFVPSDTTRAPRPGEKPVADMYFRNDYDQVINDVKTGRFVQVALGASGDLYATKAGAYPNSGVAIMPVMADVIAVFRGLGFQKTITAFIAPPTYEEWMRRIKKPGLNDQDIQERLPEAARSLKFGLTDQATHFILNDKVDDAVDQLKNLVNGYFDKKREAKARQITQSLLSTIS